MIADLKARGFTLSIDTLDPDEILMADAAGVDYVLSLNGDNREIARAAARDAGADPRHARRPRQPRRDDRPPARARQAVPRRPDHRADRLGLRREPRPLPGGAPPPSRRRDVHGHRQPDRAHRGRHHRRHRDAARLLPGARHPQRADHRGHRLGARRRPRGGPRRPAHALRPAGGHAAQARRRPAADDQGRGVPPVHARPSCASCRRASPTPTSASSRTPTGSTRSTPSTSSRAPTSTRSSTSSASTSTRTPSTWARSS